VTITSGNLFDGCEVCTAYVIDYMTQSTGT